jgi:DNA-binding helix-hairpin-helix protein with protein kinase domain
MKVWAYVHPKLNILCCALLLEAVPEGVEAIEFEVESPDDLTYDGTQIRLITQDEKLQGLKTQKLLELKTYVAGLLAQTDYVITKIAEAQIQGNTAEVEALKQKYSAQLQQREAIRAWNEQMKQMIRNVTSLEELKAIEIRFEGV